MANFDEQAFLSSLSDIPWDTAYTFDDVNDIWCHWKSLLKQAIDHHAPLNCKRVKLKSNHLPWINPAIQKQMRVRIFCIRNSAEFLRMKTGITTNVGETRSQL